MAMHMQLASATLITAKFTVATASTKLLIHYLLTLGRRIIEDVIVGKAKEAIDRLAELVHEEISRRASADGSHSEALRASKLHLQAIKAGITPTYEGKAYDIVKTD